jgi:tetratricopeptide (TPR) repeat protein
MRRFPFVLVLVLAPLPVQAADDWVGLTVFSTKDQLPLRNASGDKIGEFSYSGTVTRDLGEWIEVRHVVHPGPYIGRVKKTEVVKLADAEKFFSEKIKKDGKDTWAFRNRATARLTDKDYDGAIDDLTAAIDADPHQSLYVERGRAKRAKGDLDGAIKDYTEALKLEPGYSVALNNRGVVWEAKMKYDEAIKDYTEAIKSDPKYSTPYRNRGLVHQRRGDYAMAAKDFTEAVDLDPDNPTTIDDLAWLLATCPEAPVRNGKKAVTLAKKACELTEHRNMLLVETLAAAYAETGDFEKAVETQKKVLDDKDYMKKWESGVKLKLKLYEENKPYHTSPIKGGTTIIPPLIVPKGANLPRSEQR